MKANELRMGNLILHKAQIRKIIYLNKDYLGTDLISNVNYNGDELAYYYNIKPIPLTEEWLLKFGFEFLKNKIGTNGIYSNGKVNVCLSNCGNVYTTKDKLIPYIHTFQNWYYYTTLTGEELTLNN